MAAVEATSELLRVATAGSVDDGKSTLIGRLLYDSKQVLADQMAHVEEVSERRGDGYVNLALLTDGLRAEREQGITIDVAYRYFQTPKRKFIIADTPGHVQYTRNMVTGASTADLSLMLLDARTGVVEQSKRHAFIASLLRIPNVVVCVNKMDLLDWDEDVFERIVADFTEFAVPLDIASLTFIPISALEGDNVVERSENMGWYQGRSLMDHLERVQVARDLDHRDARFPVQWVIPPHPSHNPDYRGYAGRMAGGAFRTGDEVVVLPSGVSTRIARINGPEGELDMAFAPMSVTLRLEDDVDVSRGDMICPAVNSPAPVREFTADVCWMAARPLRAGGCYAIKHTTRSARAVVEEVEHRVHVHALKPYMSDELTLNDIGRVRMRTSAPLVADPYARNRMSGSFILIDEATNDTVGAGMVVNKDGDAGHSASNPSPPHR